MPEIVSSPYILSDDNFIIIDKGSKFLNAFSMMSDCWHPHIMASTLSEIIEKIKILEISQFDDIITRLETHRDNIAQEGLAISAWNQIFAEIGTISLELHELCESMR